MTEYVSTTKPTRVGDKGIALIKACEGLRLKPYLCSANVPTIGYGTTGPQITLDMAPISHSEAILMLKDGLAWVEKTILTGVHVSLNQHQFDALASLIYNIGSGNFMSSTLRMKLNRGDYEGAANEFWKWRKAGGQILQGLVKRRELEERLFLLECHNDRLEVISEHGYPTPPVNLY